MLRCFTRLSLLLGLVVGPTALAGEIGLRPFTASYDLYQGGLHIAVMDLSLDRQQEAWRWVSTTRARGIYALFTRKRSYAETRFTRIGEDFRVTEISIGEHGGERPAENARFDWDRGRLEVLRKGKRSEHALGGGVYDYQSIHLLAATMGQTQLNEPTIDFYRKGKLIKSRFAYSGRKTVDIGEQKIEANVYLQKVAYSNSKVKYYYDAQNPLLPLRIEKLESGESPSILVLRHVEWGL
jgi:hypothetical protein